MRRRVISRCQPRYPLRHERSNNFVAKTVTASGTGSVTHGNFITMNNIMEEVWNEFGSVPDGTTLPPTALSSLWADNGSSGVGSVNSLVPNALTVGNVSNTGLFSMKRTITPIWNMAKPWRLFAQFQLNDTTVGQASNAAFQVAPVARGVRFLRLTTGHYSLVVLGASGTPIFTAGNMIYNAGDWIRILLEYYGGGTPNDTANLYSDHSPSSNPTPYLQQITTNIIIGTQGGTPDPTVIGTMLAGPSSTSYGVAVGPVSIYGSQQ